MIKLTNIDYGVITFEEFITKLEDFNKQIINLKQFYKENIQKKFNPKEYLEYAKNRYNTIYEDLDSYLLIIIIRSLLEYGNDKLEAILEALPDYDINNFVEDSDIRLDYWNYLAKVSDIIGEEENGEPIIDTSYLKNANIHLELNDRILFTGGLVQYAILMNDLSMLKFLYEKGANLKLIIDGVDYTWDYVNSQAIMDYLESIIGKQKYGDLTDEEEAYYLNLINLNLKDDEQPRKLTLKNNE